MNASKRISDSSARVWAFRLLIIAGIILACTAAGSSIPAYALALAWSPNGLFLYLYQRGALSLPRFLERVRPLEPVLYGYLGVTWMKKLVATPTWPLLLGFAPAERLTDRHRLLLRTDQSARISETCHLATFILCLAAITLCLTTGRFIAAAWIGVFNVALNGYPVMLQRVHRWRVQQCANRRSDRNLAASASAHE